MQRVKLIEYLKSFVEKLERRCGPSRLQFRLVLGIFLDGGFRRRGGRRHAAGWFGGLVAPVGYGCCR